MSSTNSSTARSFLFAAAAVTVISTTVALYYFKVVTKSVKDSRDKNKSKRRIRILYGTSTGTAKLFADTLARRITGSITNIPVVDVTNLADYDEDKLEKEDIVFLLCSTWTNGKAPASCKHFFDWLNDYAYDFRVSKDHLAKVTFAAFGLGGEIYGENYCKVIKDFNEHMQELGATHLPLAQDPVDFGDDASDLEYKFNQWASRIIKYLCNLESNSSSQIKTQSISMKGKNKSSKSQKIQGKRIIEQHKHTKAETVDNIDNDSNTADEIEEEDNINDYFVELEETHDADNIESSGFLDVEDIGSKMSKAKKRQLKEDLASASATSSKKEMVTRLQRKALTKEGYRIIGTHSAVKLCRWTKNQMRGRGGCYKHSFYGITSYQCMEATPSLACANKCVFCWRHHKNPVGTEWRWKEDSPDMIVSQAIDLHRGMINEMRGVPGVIPERLLEAYTVKHCALSLVGEPIMYPRINELMKELHDRRISTFLVTNAQFPEEIANLPPVTQLYVSVDAATRESLKAVDRPLFKDFWERFLGSLQSLRERKQRTVYRLTLVKAYNMEELEGYVQLIEGGQPDFIEIKAVTFCGKSDGSDLTMENVPWHKDVCIYGEAICQLIRKRGVIDFNYSIATEHEHSCCILIAREDKFKIEGRWHTWIDYEKFADLITEYYDSGGKKTFNSSHYLAPTPEWSLYKSNEQGFDPVDKRHRRKTKAEKDKIEEEKRIPLKIDELLVGAS